MKAGDPIEVTVGPMLRHHGGALRSFERADGERPVRAGRGRATAAPTCKSAAGKSRSALTAAARACWPASVEGGALTATVVPARADGCYTITLLELLHQHWTKAQSGNGVEYHVLDQTRRNSAASRSTPPSSTTPPNEHGFAAARLLHQDGTLGIRHYFDFSVVSRSGQQDAADVSGGARGRHRRWPPGIRCCSTLSATSRGWRSSGLDLDVLTGIVGNSQRQLELTGSGTR